MKMTLLLILFSSAFSSTVFSTELCTKWEREKLGKIDQKRIDESSGIAVSQKQANVLWTHNDSSDEARIFAINDKGNDLGEFLIEDADAIDWEDIAIAPCSLFDQGTDSDCLFIADTGNNTSKRQTFSIYVVEEPIIKDGDEKDRTLPLVKKINFQYEKKARNSEAFFVNEDGIWLFDKGEATDLFHLGFSDDTATYLNKQKEIEFVTAADINATGNAFVLRSNDGAWWFEIKHDESVADAFEGKYNEIDIEKEPHGEGIGWDGNDLITSSEGENSRLNRYKCANLDKADEILPNTNSNTAVAGGGCASISAKNGNLIFLFALFYFLRKRKRV